MNWEKKTVLIIHEESEERQRLKSLIKENDFNCVIAANMSQAAQLLKDGTHKPDIILVEYSIYKQEHELCLLRFNKVFRGLPFLIPARPCDDLDIIDYSSNTIVDFIMIPFKESELKFRLNRILNDHNTFKFICKDNLNLQETENLKIRLRELNCLYNISKLTEKSSTTEEDVCKEIVNILLYTKEHPEIASVKLLINRREYFSDNYNKTECDLSSNIIIHGKEAGNLKVFYNIEKIRIPEKSFIDKEEGLIQAVAERLGRIIERLRAKKELEESKKRFKDISYATGGWLWEIDQNGNYIYCSENVKEVLGYFYYEMLGKSPFEFIDPQEVEKIKDTFNEIKRNRQPIVDLENWNITKSGERICFLTNASPVFDRTGRLVGYRGVDKDITQKKIQDEEIEKLNVAVNSSISPISMFDLNYKLIYSNKAFDQMWGYSDNETDSMLIFSFVSSDSLEKLQNEIVPCILKKTVWSGELKGLKKDGTVFSAYMKASLVIDKGGKPIGMIASFDDLTERISYEKKLKVEHDYATGIINNTPAIICSISPDGKCIFINPAGEKITGYTAKELINQDWWKTLYPEELYWQVDKLFEDFKKSSVREYEMTLERKNGHKCTVAWNSLNRFDHEGRLKEIIGFGHDVTERNRIKKELKKSLNYIENIFNSVVEMLIVTDTKLIIQSLNPAVCNILGFNREEIIGKSIACINDPNSTDEIEFCCEAVEMLKSNGSVKDFEHEFKSKSGEKIPVSCTGSILKDENNNAIGFVIFARDLREIKKMEKIINDREMTLKNMYDSKLMGFLLWDADSEIIDSNDTFLKMLGYSKEEFFSKSVFWQDIVSEEYVKRDIEILSELADDKDVLPFEDEYVCRNGNKISVLVGATVLPDPGIGGAAFVLDITERKRLAEQLQQSEKMEAIGQLSGGIAHDFNNILAVILASAEACLNNISSNNSQIYSSLKEILSAGNHAKNVVKQLLLFARKTKIEKAPLKINVAIRNALNLIKHTIPSNVMLKTYISKYSGYVCADPTQISQLIINLCTNALHALEKKGGIIKINVAEIVLDEESVNNYDNLVPGHYARLSVSDTGHGIMPEHRQQLFEPYFTTKPVDKGTGLGLAVTHGIVKDLKGDILVESYPDQGTTFHILLPQTEKRPYSKLKKDNSTKTEISRKLKILLIDDEKAVLRSMKLLLTMKGFEVEEKTDPVEALEMLRKYPKEFDLIITDMTMPTMPGDKLAVEALKICDRIPIVLCTGFNEKIDEKRAKSIGISRYIEKPFTEKEITEVINDILKIYP